MGVDLRRVIIDFEGIQRQVIPLTWISLTDLKCNIGRGARVKNVKKAMAKESIMEKWAKTNWAKKIAAREAKKSLTDFERFQLQFAKSKVNKEVKKTMKPKKSKK